MLWARGVSRIDTIFLSHADQDHYGGLTDLLDRFPIGTVRVPPGFASEANPGPMQLVNQIRSRGIPVQPITAPQSWETAGVGFRVLHPPAGWHPETSDNARSIVLDIAYAGRHLLLTGDLEQLGLVELVAQTPPQPPPDVFLAPHHGGRTANPESLYEWAKPRLVVVSQRPLTPTTNDALSVVERRGIPLLRTWRKGSIRLRWTQDGITARGFLDETSDQGDERGPVQKREAASRSWPARDLEDAQPPVSRSTGSPPPPGRPPGICIGCNRLSGLGGGRVRCLGVGVAASVDQGRRRADARIRRHASHNAALNGSRFRRRTVRGCQPAGSQLLEQHPRGEPCSCFTGSPKPRPPWRHDGRQP